MKNTKLYKILFEDGTAEDTMILTDNVPEQEGATKEMGPPSSPPDVSDSEDDSIPSSVSMAV